jgi:hypothetical protein
MIPSDVLTAKIHALGSDEIKIIEVKPAEPPVDRLRVSAIFLPNGIRQLRRSWERSKTTW